MILPLLTPQQSAPKVLGKFCDPVHRAAHVDLSDPTLLSFSFPFFSYNPAVLYSLFPLLPPFSSPFPLLLVNCHLAVISQFRHHLFLEAFRLHQVGYLHAPIVCTFIRVLVVLFVCCQLGIPQLCSVVPQGPVLQPVHFCIMSACYNPDPKLAFDEFLIKQLFTQVGNGTSLGDMVVLNAHLGILKVFLRALPVLRIQRNPPFHNATMISWFPLCLGTALRTSGMGSAASSPRSDGLVVSALYCH